MLLLGADTAQSLGLRVRPLRLGLLALAAALAGALTESGFLERCYPRRTYIPATEEALEALRDWAAEEGLHGL